MAAECAVRSTVEPGTVTHSKVVADARVALKTREGQSLGTFRLSIDGVSPPTFTPDPDLGGLPAADVDPAFGSGALGERTLVVSDAGDLAPGAPRPGDPSALDADKLSDVLLYLEYGVATS